MKRERRSSWLKEVTHACQNSACWLSGPLSSVTCFCLSQQTGQRGKHPKMSLRVVESREPPRRGNVGMHSRVVFIRSMVGARPEKRGANLLSKTPFVLHDSQQSKIVQSCLLRHAFNLSRRSNPQQPSGDRGILLIDLLFNFGPPQRHISGLASCAGPQSPISSYLLSAVKDFPVPLIKFAEVWKKKGGAKKLYKTHLLYSNWSGRRTFAFRLKISPQTFFKFCNKPKPRYIKPQLQQTKPLSSTRPGHIWRLMQRFPQRETRPNWSMTSRRHAIRPGLTWPTGATRPKLSFRGASRGFFKKRFTDLENIAWGTTVRGWASSPFNLRYSALALRRKQFNARHFKIKRRSLRSPARKHLGWAPNVVQIEQQLRETFENI